LLYAIVHVVLLSKEQHIVATQRAVQSAQGTIVKVAGELDVPD